MAGRPGGHPLFEMRVSAVGDDGVGVGGQVVEGVRRAKSRGLRHKDEMAAIVG